MKKDPVMRLYGLLDARIPPSIFYLVTTKGKAVIGRQLFDPTRGCSKHKH